MKISTNLLNKYHYLVHLLIKFHNYIEIYNFQNIKCIIETIYTHTHIYIQLINYKFRLTKFYNILNSKKLKKIIKLFILSWEEKTENINYIK
jgi:hypothetical protein